MGTEKSIQILYDENCPICLRKARFLQKYDHQGRLSFLDIRKVDLHALDLGVSMADLEKQIHAILPDGTIIHRMDVLRVAYRAIGLGWIIAPTGWPFLKPLFDALYGGIAKYRLPLSRFFR